MIAAVFPLDRWIAGRLGLGGAPLDRAAIEAWQMDCLRQTLDWARGRSAFYRRHLSSLDGAPPRSLADFAEYPFTTAADIQADPLQFLCLSQGDISRVVTLDTSGTTGLPKRIFFTGEDQEVTLGFFEHGLRQMAGPGDKVMILLPGDRPGGVGDLLSRAIRRLDATPVPVGISQDAKAVAELGARNAASLLIGIPVQVLAVARHWRAMGLPRDCLRRVLLCSDNISEAVCAEIAALLDCEIFRDWGMTEMGYGGGVDCIAHDGYHLQEADFLFEVVDPRSGRPLPPEALGEVVFTTLTRRGMPLIRYRTGDLARLVEDPCPCGSALRRLDRIETRKTGLVSLSGGDISMAALDDALFEIPGIADFSASLLREGRSPILRIEVFQRTRAEGRPGLDAMALQSAVMEALDSIPVMRRSSDVAIEVVLRPDMMPVSRGKRMIRLEEGT
ncbi:DVU_1553 family AMP-dependent CoA ligase [Telmatospirillum siberiense]|uniref:AMP-dependent synthetase n=1 Tax=Telmatospirillum siberiense TaxID=382514 RepID=A0A2N3PWZ1_9PROT|nr:AMP-binding protein [Telmatospirillum siberiense]PKU24917.1 AMP-dependent synthetase [Telmatospirillum siberiense]